MQIALTGPERRRCWDELLRLQIWTEAFSPGACATQVARIIRESEDLLFNLIDQMESEDGLVWVYNGEDNETPALSSDGINCIRDLIAEHRHNQDQK